MKNKNWLKIKEFLQTNKKVLLLILAVIFFFVLPMIAFGVKKAIVGVAIIIGVSVWCNIFFFLLYSFYEFIDSLK